MRHVATVVLAASMFGLSAHAQTAATDDELYAAYCLGATETLRTIFGELPELQQRQQRFAGYLMARGVLVPDLTDMRDTRRLLGLLAAKRQGQVQARTCFDKLNSCDFSSKDGFPACIARTGATLECRQSVRCSKPDDLPF